LERQGYHNIITRTHKELDLQRQEAVEEFFAAEKPEYVFLAAAKVGGIVANESALADFMYDNMMLEMNVIHSAWKNGCKKLEFLELGYCSSLKDVSALEGLPNLQYLNLGFTSVKDLTPLYDLPLKRFVCLGPRMSWEEQEAFKEQHPDCWIRFTGENPYSLGWRYDDIGETYSDIYRKVREVFDLDSVDQALRKQEAQNNAANSTPPPTPDP
jgi:hypothetical protein